MGLTPQQFQEMQARLTGRRRVAGPVWEGGLQPQSKRHQVILGIDPSLRGTGYGVIRLARPTPATLAQGVVRCPPSWERTRCLAQIAQTVRDLIRQHQPTVCVVEGLFYAQNLRTALVMGEARGASLVAAAEAGLEVFEVAPRKVKQAVAGHGGAQKLAVARMVQRLLHLTEVPASDAADALALAVTFAQEQGRYPLSPPKRL
jgi:crossover junction endodeoxyribonuclease RuvC